LDIGSLCPIALLYNSPVLCRRLFEGDEMTDIMSPVGTRAAIRRMLSELPAASPYAPTAEALKRANELGETGVAAALQRFLSMPQSTMILANPSLHQIPVDCQGGQVKLDIRSFAIRGVVAEHEIVSGAVGPLEVIFVGLFGRRPEGPPNGISQAGVDEAGVLAALLDRAFFRACDRSVAAVADFVARFPGLGPEIAVQHFSVLRKAGRKVKGSPERGLNDERRPGALLVEMISTHMENVALGGLSMYANHLLLARPGLSAADLARETAGFVTTERQLHPGGCAAFPVSYGLLLGRSLSAVECRIVEQMGTIQTHHGSAGSNMVARYLATLHAGSVSDFFVACQMVMDSARHFGAIHDLTAFIRRLEPLAPAERDALIRRGVLGGGLPTFGHPEITAAGRSGEVEADPRPAIYVTPLFAALDRGELALSAAQRERLGIIQRIYQIAFVEGVVKRAGEEPLRITPNTDFGAWSVQEALGIRDPDRTFLTYIFRGFGWTMDAREQLLQKIIRPVIAPDPRIVPKRDAAGDTTIPDLVGRFHDRLKADAPAFAPRK
jgi:hypothetical protein